MLRADAGGTRDGAIEVRRLTRPYTDRLREYHVLIDEQRVGTLRYGETGTYPVEAGSHRVQIRIDWTRSQPQTVEVTVGKTAALECRGRNPLGALYWISVGRNRYVRLEIARP